MAAFIHFYRYIQNSIIRVTKSSESISGACYSTSHQSFLRHCTCVCNSKKSPCSSMFVMYMHMYVGPRGGRRHAGWHLHREGSAEPRTRQGTRPRPHDGRRRHDPQPGHGVVHHDRYRGTARGEYRPTPCGMVWYGMVWYGMVWYGMVWRSWHVFYQHKSMDRADGIWLRYSILFYGF